MGVGGGLGGSSDTGTDGGGAGPPDLVWGELLVLLKTEMPKKA